MANQNPSQMTGLDSITEPQLRLPCNKGGSSGCQHTHTDNSWAQAAETPRQLSWHIMAMPVAPLLKGLDSGSRPQLLVSCQTGSSPDYSV